MLFVRRRAGIRRHWKSSSEPMPNLLVPQVNQLADQSQQIELVRLLASTQVKSGGYMSPEVIFQLHLVFGYVACLLCFSAYVFPDSN